MSRPGPAERAVVWSPASFRDPTCWTSTLPALRVTGFIYDQNRQVMLDPDAQVRDTIVHLFVTFERTGSACAVVRRFRDRAMKFPHRQGHGHRLGALRWQAL